LRHWLHHPLRDNAPILERHGIIHSLLSPSQGLESFGAINPLHTLRQALRHFPDIERIATRVALRSVRPRELASLRDALQALPAVQAQLLEAFETNEALRKLSHMLSIDPTLPLHLQQAVAQ